MNLYNVFSLKKLLMLWTH